MTLQDKKLAVLNRLNLESEPTTLFDLLDHLGESYTERTLRRWLSQFVAEGVVRKIGQKRGTKYLIEKLFTLPEHVASQI